MMTAYDDAQTKVLPGAPGARKIGVFMPRNTKNSNTFRALSWLRGLSLGLLASALHSAHATAWVRPYLPGSKSPIPKESMQLDYMLLDVEGESLLVRAGDEVVMVKGDVFVVREARLKAAHNQAQDLNVVGFQHNQARQRSTDDRNIPIDSDRALQARFSEGGLGEVYAINAENGSTVHGGIFVRFIAPQLRYVEVRVNGAPRTLKDGEPLTLKRSDRFKIEQIKTNMRSTKGLKFQFLAVGHKPQAKSELAAGEYEIRFARGERVFATIPVKVVD